MNPSERQLVLLDKLEACITSYVKEFDGVTSAEVLGIIDMLKADLTQCALDQLVFDDEQAAEDTDIDEEIDEEEEDEWI